MASSTKLSPTSRFALMGAIAAKVLAGMLASEVRAARERAGVDSFTSAMRKLVLSTRDKPTRKAWAVLSDHGAANCDAIFAKNEAILRPLVEAELVKMEIAAKAREAEAAEKAKIAAMLEM
mgnify:CR=1 FL=1